MYEILSETQQMFNGEKFYLCGSYFQHNGKRLHRTVWKFYNGKIPSGYHVHHIDGNTANNDIANLMLMKQHDHLSIHSSTEEAKERSRKHIDSVRHLALAWHKSPEASALYRANASEWSKHRKPKSLKCQYCGEDFTSTSSDAKFCSNACKSAARRDSGVDNETRHCVVCGKGFEVNKYAGIKCCSRKCASELHSRQMREKGRNSRCLQLGG